MNPSSEAIFGARINGGDIQPELVVVVARTCRSEMLINGHGFFVLQYFDLLDHQCIAALMVEMYLPTQPVMGQMMADEPDLRFAGLQVNGRPPGVLP